MRRFVLVLFILIASILLLFKFLKSSSSRPLEEDFYYVLTKEEKKQLQTGDIILRRGYGFVSTMILKMMQEEMPVTHLGIIIRNGDSLKVAHSLSSTVSDQDGLRLQQIDSFTHNSYDSTLLVTRLKTIRKTDVERIRKQVAYYNKKQLPFDDAFDYKDTTAHYCSEFIWRVYEHNLKILKVADSITEKEKYNTLKTFYDINYFDIIINHND